MREIRTEADIAAPPEHVWEVLTDFASYPQWNPFIPALEGEPEVGASLRMRTQPPGKRANTLTARVLIAKMPHHLRWQGIFLNPRLFEGTHILELSPREGGTHVVNREEFRGVLAPLLLRYLGSNLPTGYEVMNAALKARAEASS